MTGCRWPLLICYSVCYSLQDVLSRLDGFLDVPEMLIGYGMIRRSLSVRSKLRVPTHIICAPSGGISLAEMVQMMGRGMGNNRCVRRAANPIMHVVDRGCCLTSCNHNLLRHSCTLPFRLCRMLHFTLCAGACFRPTGTVVSACWPTSRTLRLCSCTTTLWSTFTRESLTG